MVGEVLSYPSRDNSRDLHFGRLMRAYEALASWRACALTISGLAAFILILAAGLGTKNVWIAVLASIPALGALLAGVSGAGVLLMDLARNIPPRAMLDAAVFGLLTVLKVLVVLLGFLALTVGIAITVALAFLIGKIPGVGPLLFSIVFPPAALILGVTLMGLVLVGFPMMLPALWEGRSIAEAFAVMVAIARQRLVLAIHCMFIVGILSAITATVTSSILLTGIVSAGLIAAPIVSVPFFDMPRMGFDALDHMSGHLLAFGLDVLIMIGITLVLIGQVSIMGLNLVYLTVSEALDSSEERYAIDGLARAKKKAEDVARHAQDAALRAKELAEQARQGSNASRAEVSGGAAADAGPSKCPGCNAQIGPTDVFCGECGFKLKP